MSPPPGAGAPARAAQRLFLLGFLTLFLELLLIRYLAGSIWNLGFFPNLVLLGAFLGMGTGFVCHQALDARASARVFGAVAPALLALVGFVVLLHPSVPGFASVSGEIGGEVFFTATAENAHTNYGLFALWLLAVIAIFAMIAQQTAKLFALFAPLRAYTLDIAGSCCGILCFMAVSALELRAALWFLACIPLLALADPRPSRARRAVVGAALLACAGLVQLQDGRLIADPDFAGRLEVHWSPYQKVELALADGADPFVFVNGVKHQAMHRAEDIRRIFYQLPHDQRRQERPQAGPYRRVLVIGAGSGNDVASALMNGARQVEAVEIDPVIAALGRRHHPARPYQDPRVELVIGDGRAHLTRGEGPYDLIVFALTDSLVKVSPMAQLRLENYLFTVESLRRGFELLAPDGTLVLYNYYREPWVLEKLELAIREATGREPRRLIDGRIFALLTVEHSSPPASRQPATAGLEASRDDWPFPYLRRRALPPVYLGAMAIVLLYAAGVFLFVQRRLRGRSQAAATIPFAVKLAFALMGAAFLLLETKSIIQFSLLFGTTWLNNSLVFLAVLALVLAANWTAQLVRGRWLWGAILPLLLASSLAPLAWPLSNLLYVEHEGLRFAAASLLTFSPVFFANLLFSLAFRDQRTAEHLFGWNLFGSTLGGVLEYSSLALGYGALAVVVAGCYAAAFGLLALGGALRPLPGPGPGTGPTG